MVASIRAQDAGFEGFKSRLLKLLEKNIPRLLEEGWEKTSIFGRLFS